MISDYNIIDTVLFSDSLGDIRKKLESIRKDVFNSTDRIIIQQDVADDYPYIDAAGVKLIELQKIINRVDISNCFILLITTNSTISDEVAFITKFYSTDKTPINTLVVHGDYKKEIKKYTDTTCQKLWNHLYIGTDQNINPCCIADHRFPLGNINENEIDVILSSEKPNQIREWMQQGYRTIACNRCYVLEDNGIVSLRKSGYKPGVDITSLDIRIDNICNFKCRMCSEYFSSSIQQETVAMFGSDGIMGFENNNLIPLMSTQKKEVFNTINPYITNNIRDIYFAGGEPLITQTHYQILDKLIDIGNTDLTLTYNTNLSTLTYKNLKVTDYWNQFNNVEVGASIDASDSVAEYVRHGTIWSDIIKNIISIKQYSPNVILNITSTVSFLTIENLITLQTTWLKEKFFDIKNFSVSVLTSPEFLSPAALPQYHKQRLGDLIKSHIDNLGKSKLAFQWGEVLKFMNNTDYTYTTNDFKDRMRDLDNYRNESFVKVFPEFKDIYDPN